MVIEEKMMIILGCDLNVVNSLANMSKFTIIFIIFAGNRERVEL